MEIKQALSLIAGVLFLMGFVPYIRAILRGETKPAKASWIIWAALDTISLVGMYYKHAVNGQIVGAVVGAWTVAFLAIFYGVRGWTKLDKGCLVGAVLGIVLWLAFDDPTIGIVVSGAVIILGSVPTLQSAWAHPACEDKTAWTIYWLSCVAAMAAIPAWTLPDATQPTAFFVIESTMMYILYLRPKRVLVK